MEEHVAQLLGGTDVEFGSSDIVDFSGFGVGFALQLCGHLGQGFGVDLYSAMLHAGEHGNERQIYFFVKLRESFAFKFFAARRDAAVVTAAVAGLSGSLPSCDSSWAGSSSGVEATSACSMAIASAPPATTELRTASTSAAEFAS